MDQWYYSRNGQQLGPVSWEELYRLANSGGFAATDFVWREGMPNWVEARTVQGLVAGPAQPQAPQPSYPQPQPQYQQPAYPPQGYPQQGYGAPGYPQPVQPVGYQSPYGPSGPRPGSPLVWAILATIFCCLPFGIVAIVYSAQVNSKWDSGDYQGAWDASRKATMWGWIAAACGLIGSIIWGIAVAAGGRY